MNLFANFKWQCFGIFSIFSHSHTCAPSAYSANNSAKNFHFLVTMFSIQFSRSHWILIDIVDLRVFPRHIENCTFLEFLLYFRIVYGRLFRDDRTYNLIMEIFQNVSVQLKCSQVHGFIFIHMQKAIRVTLNITKLRSIWMPVYPLSN